MTTEQILKLLSPIITLLLGTIIKYYTETRSKLVSYIGHISSFTLQDAQKTVVFTHSIILRNAGNKSAHNVRVGHNYLPPNITVFPKIKYSVERNDDGSGELLIPVLVPKEQITISYLYFPPTTWDKINAYAKSDDGLAKIITVIPTVQLSKWLIALIWTLIFIGASFTLYWILRLLVSVI